MNVVVAVLQAVAVILLAPLASGFARWMRAKMHTRKGPSILQDYYDIAKLFKRQDVHTKDSGWIHRAMPVMFFGIMFALALGVPMFTIGSPIPLMGDVILVVYLLALARFLFSLAAVDNGDSYGGIGGLREMMMGVLVEPTMILALFVMALATASLNIGGMGAIVASGRVMTPIAVVLAGVAFALACYIELGKLPFDTAEAEQEIQEGALQGYSGPSQALLSLAMSMKQIIMVSWFLAIFIPFGAAADFSLGGIVVGALVWFVKAAVIFFICTFPENLASRVRYKNAGRQTWAIFGISVFALVFCLMGI